MNPSLSAIANTVLTREEIMNELTHSWYLTKLSGDRSDRSEVAKSIKMCETIREEYRQHDKANEFSMEDVLKIFLSYICFFSSIDLSFTHILGKSIVCIGSNYGMEVILLRSLGIRAYGIESDEALYTRSQLLHDVARISFPENDLLQDSLFFFDDVRSYASLATTQYDMVIARNLNPLAPVPEMIKNIGGLVHSQGYMLLQWDAVYKEEIATSLYDVEGVAYNEKLRSLLDALYLYTYEEERPRARFLYTMQAP